MAGWDYNAAYLRSVNTADYAFSSGYLSTPAFVAAMATGLVNPFGPTGDAGLALMSGAQVAGTVRDAKGTLDLFDASFTRDVMRLPAGPLSVAIGGEWRREHLTDEPSAVRSRIRKSSTSSYPWFRSRGGARRMQSSPRSTCR